jgi:hypothetical protein
VYDILFLPFLKLNNLKIPVMARKEEETAHVEFNHAQDVGETNKGALGEKEAFGEREALGELREKQALGDVGGWQASVEDAHLANINEHEITVRQTYVFSVLIFPSWMSHEL